MNYLVWIPVFFNVLFILSYFLTKVTRSRPSSRSLTCLLNLDREFNSSCMDIKLTKLTGHVTPQFLKRIKSVQMCIGMVPTFSRIRQSPFNQQSPKRRDRRNLVKLFIFFVKVQCRQTCDLSCVCVYLA